MKKNLLPKGVSHPQTFYFTAVLVIILFLSIPAFNGEIHDAAKTGDIIKIKWLLKDIPELVFSVDKSGQTPLHIAAGNGNKDIVELLLAAGANVNARDNSSNTPLHFAAATVQKEVVELLLAKKADVNAKNNQGITPLHGASIFIYLGILKIPPGQRMMWQIKKKYRHKEVVELLLSSGADINARTNQGDTPLHGAVKNDYRNMVEFLIANKADLNAENSRGMTPLDIAESIDNTDMVELLRRYGGQSGSGGITEQGSAMESGVRPESSSRNSNTRSLAIQDNKEFYYQGPDVKPPESIAQPAPQYTNEARELHIGGILKLQVVIRKDGTVDVRKILNGLGHGLDESAIDTISNKWRFKPGTLEGMPVDYQAEIEVEFVPD